MLSSILFVEHATRFVKDINYVFPFLLLSAPLPLRSLPCTSHIYSIINVYDGLLLNGKNLHRFMKLLVIFRQLPRLL